VLAVNEGPQPSGARSNEPTRHRSIGAGRHRPRASHVGCFAGPHAGPSRTDTAGAGQGRWPRRARGARRGGDRLRGGFRCGALEAPHGRLRVDARASPPPRRGDIFCDRDRIHAGSCRREHFEADEGTGTFARQTPATSTFELDLERACAHWPRRGCCARCGPLGRGSMSLADGRKAETCWRRDAWVKPGGR